MVKKGTSFLSLIILLSFPAFSFAHNYQFNLRAGGMEIQPKSSWMIYVGGFGGYYNADFGYGANYFSNRSGGANQVFNNAG